MSEIIIFYSSLLLLYCLKYSILKYVAVHDMTREVVARTKTLFTRCIYEQEIRERFRNRTRVGKTKKKRFEHGAVHSHTNIQL